MNFTLNYAHGIDGFSILFIVLSTFKYCMCISGASINTEKNYFLFTFYNRIIVSKCIFSDGNFLKLLYNV